MWCEFWERICLGNFAALRKPYVKSYFILYNYWSRTTPGRKSSITDYKEKDPLIVREKSHWNLHFCFKWRRVFQKTSGFGWVYRQHWEWNNNDVPESIASGYMCFSNFSNYGSRILIDGPTGVKRFEEYSPNFWFYILITWKQSIPGTSLYCAVRSDGTTPWGLRLGTNIAHLNSRITLSKNCRKQHLTLAVWLSRAHACVFSPVKAIWQLFSSEKI